MGIEITTAQEYVAASEKDRNKLLKKLGHVAREEVTFWRGDSGHPDDPAIRAAWTVEGESGIVMDFIRDKAAFDQAVGLTD